MWVIQRPAGRDVGAGAQELVSMREAGYMLRVRGKQRPVIGHSKTGRRGAQVLGVCMALAGFSAASAASAQAAEVPPPATSSEVPASEAPPPETPKQVLSLAQALSLARTNQPDLRRARAQAQAASARAQVALAPLLPQLLGTASYLRTTANFVPRPGAIPRSVNTATGATAAARKASSDMYNFYNFGLTASQILYDFGASPREYMASKQEARAQRDDQRSVELDVVLAVRTAFFQARALSELVKVADELLANQQRHLEQAEAFVEVGTRPEIDIAQSRTDVANARVQLIQAQNANAIGKASLIQAMGVLPGEFEVAEEALPPVPEEDSSSNALLSAAFAERPELVAVEHRLRAQALYLRAAKGGYGPILSANASVTAGGRELDNLVGNWNAGVMVTWPLFAGGNTYARTLEARANEQGALADQESVLQAVRFEVEQARLGVVAAKAVQMASLEALVSARERLKLAEGRYAEGVGNIIELGDAQFALTNAEAQRVQADYGVSIARAQLLRALGRSE